MERFKKLTILHSNDMHGDFLAENVNEKLTGGVSMLSGYLNKVRSEEPNTLYCVAGDMFRGSVIDSEYQGLSTVELMNMLAPDVVTLGNHETDYGIAHLLFIEKCAKFPIINANLYIKSNQTRIFDPCTILEVDGMKILFIGILTEEVMANAKNEGVIGTFVDVAEAAREVGRICNTYNALDIDLTVLLTHIGFEEDKKMAEALDPSWGVDIIIGGHSHTFIEEPAKVNDVLIVQAGTGTDQIGRFDILVDTDNNKVASFNWQPVPIDASHCPSDPEMEKLLEKFKSKTDIKYGRIVTRFQRQLTHPGREMETELGDLISEIVRECTGLDIMMFGSGSIRQTKLGPVVTYADLMECFPYDDEIIMVKLTGKQFKDIVRYMVRDEVWKGVHCEFYQFSDGLNITYNRTTKEFERFDFKGAPIEEERLYSVGFQQWHYLNIEESLNISHDEITKNMKPRIISTSVNDILDEYLSEHQHLDSHVCGRLELKD